MPKLIKIDKSQAKRVTHKKCGAVIEYFQPEVKSEYDYDCHFIICPNCKERVCVKAVW